jgi:sulfatase maturation enzyme AslB (radical SAM superfamily)|tara:strand:+ start:158 stop:910 length:753 start_codon:yes stop_codon:yes gene_type:complete
MCNPGNSSKWFEDIKIYEKYENEYTDSRDELDWEWIYSQCVDRADHIYIAGGEPFYMKPVQKFLKDLSNNPWNCQNTHITIQTNGISNTPAFLKILSKFDKIHFGISVDGWGDVNDLIRFPTKHDELMVGIQELIDVNPHRLDYNITVQAMNLLNIDTLVEEFDSRGFLLTKNQSEPYSIFNLRNPFYLNINALKPEVIENSDIKEKYIKGYIEEYKYDPENNIRMQNYLLELDKARGTNSPKTIPWCFV